MFFDSGCLRTRAHFCEFRILLTSNIRISPMVDASWVFILRQFFAPLLMKLARDPPPRRAPRLAPFLDLRCSFLPNFSLLFPQ